MPRKPSPMRSSCDNENILLINLILSLVLLLVYFNSISAHLFFWECRVLRYIWDRSGTQPPPFSSCCSFRSSFKHRSIKESRHSIESSHLPPSLFLYFISAECLCLCCCFCFVILWKFRCDFHSQTWRASPSLSLTQQRRQDKAERWEIWYVYRFDGLSKIYI